MNQGNPIPTRDPLAKLMEDHRIFLHTVHAFQESLGASGRPIAPTLALPRRIADFARFLAHDVDGVHGRQEERGLFPVLGRHLPIEGGPIGVMLAEHETLRSYQRKLEHSWCALESDLAAEEAHEAVVQVSGEVEQLLEGHVFKEDTVLFPMAYQVLSPRELEEIAQVFDDVEAQTAPR